MSFYRRQLSFKPFRKVKYLREIESENLNCENETKDLKMNPETSNASATRPVTTANDIFTNLRIPDAIKELPKFDGNPRLLYDFISNVEEIFKALGQISPEIENSPYLKLLVRAVRNKIVGPANEVLDMYGTPVNWTEIKKNLILHYSDKRNECSLIKDLHHLKQNSKTVEQFYSEVIEILATLNNYVQIHEIDQNIVQSKKGLYEKMCLGVFLTGLKEPLGSTIRAMKPENLAVAFSNCVEEQNISYMRYNNANFTKPNTQTNKPHPNQNRNNFQKTHYSNNNFSRNNFPNNFQRNNNFQRQPQTNNNFPQNQSRQNNQWQQNFSKIPSTQFPQNGFQKRPPSFQQAVRPQQQNFPAPQPMEIDSSGLTNMRAQMHNVQKKEELFFTPNKQRNFEHFQTNTNQRQQLDFFYNNDDVDEDASTDEFPNAQIFEANFPAQASRNQQDI